MEYTLLPPQGDCPVPTGQPYRTLVIVPEGILWEVVGSGPRAELLYAPGVHRFLARARDLGWEVVLWSDRWGSESLVNVLKTLNPAIMLSQDGYMEERPPQRPGYVAPTAPVVHALGADNTAGCLDWEGKERVMRDLNRIARPLQHTLAIDTNSRGFSKPADGKEHVILVPKWHHPKHYQALSHSAWFNLLSPQEQEEERKRWKREQRLGGLVLEQISNVLEGQTRTHTATAKAVDRSEWRGAGGQTGAAASSCSLC